MTEHTHDGPGLGDVREGMTVLDPDGQELGTVAEVKMSDPGAVTGAGQEMPPDNDLVSAIARAIRPGELPEQIAARLTRLGYFRIDQRLARDVLVAADQVAHVEDGQVQLNVSEDSLPRWQ